MQGYVVLNKTIKIGSKKNLGNFNITKQHSSEWKELEETIWSNFSLMLTALKKNKTNYKLQRVWWFDL